MADHKKVLILHAGTRQLAEYLQRWLEKEGISADLHAAPTSEGIEECTQYIRDHAADYQGVVLMNFTEHQLMHRTPGSDSPSMYEWAREVKKVIPQTMVYDELTSLETMGESSRIIELKRDGIPVLNTLEHSLAMAAAAVADMLEPERPGFTRSAKK